MEIDANLLAASFPSEVNGFRVTSIWRDTGSCQQPEIGKFSHFITKCDTCCSPKCSGIVEALVLVSVFFALFHLGRGSVLNAAVYSCPNATYLLWKRKGVTLPNISRLRVSLWISQPDWGSTWRASLSLGWPWHVSVQQHRHSQPGEDTLAGSFPALPNRNSRTETSSDTKKRWLLSTGLSLWEKSHNKSQEKSTSCLNHKNHYQCNIKAGLNCAVKLLCLQLAPG